MCCLDLAASPLCRCRNNFLAYWCTCHHCRCADSPYIHQHPNNSVHPEVTCSQYCQHKFLFQINFKYRYCYVSIASWKRKSAYTNSKISSLPTNANKSKLNYTLKLKCTRKLPCKIYSASVSN